MSLITGASLRSSEESKNNTDAVPVVDPVKKAESVEFAKLLKGNQGEDIAMKEMSNDGELMSPEELHQSIRESLFKSGFNRAIERAREIVKNIKG